MNTGALSVIGAYLLWGLFPLFWKTLDHVPADEILGHRVIWSFLFVCSLLALRRHWSWLPAALSSKRTIATFLGTAALIGVNWLTYIWAVNNGFIVESSLGYFINPLLSIFLGMIFLRERLRRWQWVAVAVAAAGVIYLTFVYGVFPWVSIVLALTFGFYGLLRKTAPLDATEGLAAETAILFIPAVLFLLLLDRSGAGSFGRAGTATTLLLFSVGAVTATPLLLFARGVRRITLTSVGILQYIAPTLQFLIGIYVFREPFPQSKMIGFVIVWIALVIYSAEGITAARKKL